jgi:cytolysin-activating lysine-acyltransferase
MTAMAPVRELDPEEKAASLRSAAAALGEVTSLIMRSPDHAHFTLPDLEWLVVPAIVNRQFLIVRAPTAAEAFPLPVAVVLWANVTAQIDALMTQDLSRRIKLTAQERQSGDIVWMTDLIGERTLVNAAVTQLRARELKGRPIKLVHRETDGSLSLIEHH